MSDPYAVLGVDRDASWAEVRAARLALVKALHPDAMTSAPHAARTAAERRLAEINAAYDELASAIGATVVDAPPSEPHPSADVEASTRAFVIDAFRPVAFEALVIAAADLGDITDADEPFSLEVHVEGPPTGFCRLELVPEAGGSLVTAESDQVDPVQVRDTLIRALTRLGVPASAVGP